MFRKLVSETASGMVSINAQELEQQSMLGVSGVATSPLRPGGKAQFGDQICDVMTQGQHVAKGTAVRVIGRSGAELIVEPTQET